MARIAAFVMSILALCVTAGCEHREFLYDVPSKRVPVTVEFDWKADPGANPEGMTVYFFRVGSKQTSGIAYDFKGREGGSLSLMPGVYSAICHNNDSDRHGFVGEASYDEFGLRLNDNRNAGDLHGNANSYLRNADERIAHSPDSMWVATIDMFAIDARDPLDPGRAEPIVLHFAMQPVVNHYTFHLRNPINFNKSLSVTATISGMAASVHPGRNSTGDETVTHLINMSPTADGNLRGDILAFGHCKGRPLDSRAGDEADVPHILIVYATMADGTRWSSVHDVTEQIHNSPTPDCVVLVDSVAFPQHGGGGGVSPSVGGWTGSSEPIGM